MRTLAVAAALMGVLLAAACSGGAQGPGDSGTPPAVIPPTLAPGSGNSASPSPTPEPAGTPITAPFDLPIVMYHDVSPTAPPDIYRAASNVTPDEFARQMDYLKCAGYTTITVGRLFEAIAGRGALPQKPVILTFDDGYEDHYTTVFPLLHQRGMVGSFAVITGYVEGGGDYLTWAQVQEMAASGMEFMSHTVTHIDLGTSDDATVRDQLATSKAALEERTAKPVRFLVYPSGEPFRSGSDDRQRQVVEMLRQTGYQGALLVGPSSVEQDPRRPYALSRVRVSSSTDIHTYAASIGAPSRDGCG